MTSSGGAGATARMRELRKAPFDGTVVRDHRPHLRLGRLAGLAGSGWPFVPLAPLVVVFVGLAVALGIGLVGLDHLARAGDEHASARAELVAATVAARLSQLPAERRLDATQLAARRTAAGILVVTSDARVVHDVDARRTRSSRAREDARRRQGRRAAPPRSRALRGAPDRHAAARRATSRRARRRAATPQGAPGLVTALLALAVMLLGVAAAVAYAVSRDVTRDVDFVTRRIDGMAQVRTEPTGELIPARTMDEVGLLTDRVQQAGRPLRKGREGVPRRTSRARAPRTASAQRSSPPSATSCGARSTRSSASPTSSWRRSTGRSRRRRARRSSRSAARARTSSTLINDILEFSALESGQLRSRAAASTLTRLAQRGRAARRAASSARSRCTVRVEGEPSLVARVDGRRVRQILGNLVNNAIKFTQRARSIVARRARGRARLAQRHATPGPGISAQERAVIFDEYKQARSERMQRRGTGLGLAIARRLVMLHHGSIQVESELGRGSTFKVLLPIGNIDAQRRRSRAPPAQRRRRRDEPPCRSPRRAARRARSSPCTR